jgi:hypothetical protein
MYMRKSLVVELGIRDLELGFYCKNPVLQLVAALSKPAGIFFASEADKSKRAGGIDK